MTTDVRAQPRLRVSSALADGAHPKALQQWWALTTRGLAKVVRNGEIILAFLSPIFLAVCFYLPLRKVMDSLPGVNYGQFLMPIILLQAVSFAVSAAAMRASLDATQGINTRFRVLPMRAWIPMLARTATNVVLLGIAIGFGCLAALVIGWRPGGGVLGTIGVIGFVALVGVLLSMVADGIGLVAGSPEATSQALMLPTLILGMLSTGFVPESRFPEWIRPFARNQPISQFVDVMRVLDSPDTVRWATVGPSIWWCLALAVAAVVLLFVGSRRVRT
ncbi:ABC transporter permease [Gordonia otitidis]|uniref:ABC transporter permease protein n=1 Tax=Gordonia otitidis (strain DSM 44809 / CCUG 52243 / JCM 12355 / NBRC 100426 / IFM 10032) TaxID=1108044 RepID=H5TG21_GORO1|nr:ABC transporter permease [Gordonia otitidis]GAB32429.1 putative ABC transporter permease protein [Gordonia otitidis NBRC 100426]